MKADCDNIRAAILAGEFEAGPEVQRHVEECDACRELLAGGPLVELLRDSGPSLAPPPAGGALDRLRSLSTPARVILLALAVLLGNLDRVERGAAARRLHIREVGVPVAAGVGDPHMAALMGRTIEETPPKKDTPGKPDSLRESDKKFDTPKKPDGLKDSAKDLKKPVKDDD